MPFGGLLTAGLISGGSQLFSGILGANAAGKAADVQAGSEQQILDLLKTIQPQAQADISGGVNDANSTLAKYYGANMSLLSPYLSSGTDALSQLAKLTGGGGFQAPTSVTEANDPGYQFREQQGQQALQRAQASTGAAEGGAAQKELARYNQDYASNEYGNVYNRALGTYQTNFGNLQSLAGLGLSATNTGVNSGNIAGTQTAANQFGAGQLQANQLLQGLGISADALTGAANARASGYVGAANAYGGAATNAGNNFSNLLLLNSLMNKPSTGSSYGPLGTPTANPNISTGDLYTNPAYQG